MKHIVRVFLFNAFGIWFTGELIPFFHVGEGWQAVLFAALLLSILMLIIRPILKILFIPINIMTFGLLSWLVNVIMVYILTIIEPSITINAWTFPGATFQGFVIPEIQLSYIVALILTTLTLTCITNTLHGVNES